MKTTFNELIEGDTPVLVDFYADWCGPCKAMTPVIKSIAEKNQGKLRVIKIDTDKNPEVSAHYGIRGIPAFKLFKKGKVIWEGSGAMPENDLMRQINPFL